MKLAPSGYHVMFTDLKRPLVKGESVKATLTFEHAGAVVVDFAVQGVGAAGPGGGMNGAGHEGDEDVRTARAAFAFSRAGAIVALTAGK